MLLYEIDAALADLLAQVDEETGELLAKPEDIEALMMEREAALEGMALTVKNLTAEAAAIRAEELALADRRGRLEHRAEKIKGFLQDMLAGQRLQTPRVAVTYRTSESVDTTDDFWVNAPMDYIRVKDPEPDKAAIKRALKQGIEIPGVVLVTKVNMNIK